MLREAYCLVRDDVVSVEDVDLIMRDGLGLRWSAVAGPFETADLNARGGIVSHAKNVGDTYARMGAERGQHDPWDARPGGEGGQDAPRGPAARTMGRARGPGAIVR